MKTLFLVLLAVLLGAPLVLAMCIAVFLVMAFLGAVYLVIALFLASSWVLFLIAMMVKSCLHTKRGLHIETRSPKCA